MNRIRVVEAAVLIEAGWNDFDEVKYIYIDMGCSCK